MYNVDWDALLLQSMKPTMLNEVDIAFMRALWQPFKRINVTVNSAIDNNKILLRYNASKIYLERYLNELYGLLNATNKIYITNNAPRPVVSLYQASEGREGFMIYLDWNNQEAYVANNRVFRLGFVYRSKTSNSDKAPESNPLDWENEGAMPSFYQLHEVAQNSSQFTVYVPSALSFNAEVLRAQLYKFLPLYKSFLIQIY